VKKAAAVLFVVLSFMLALPTTDSAAMGQTQSADPASQTRARKNYVKEQKKSAKKLKKSQAKAQKQSIKLHESGH